MDHPKTIPTDVRISRSPVREPCVTLVGMAGTGKSTVGLALARELGWAHLDTDRLLEAYFGAPLQMIFDQLGLADFLLAEERLVSQLNVSRCVISTGGSVIYGPSAVERLKELGPVVMLTAGLGTVRSRLEDASGRGLAIAPGQSLEALYAERQPLYEAAAVLVVDTGESSAEDCVRAITRWLESVR